MGHEELIGFDLEKADGGDSGEGVNGSRNRGKGLWDSGGKPTAI